MQKIIPFLWFDNQAKQAIEFYISVFAPFDRSEKGQTSKITLETTYHNSGPDGKTDTFIVEFKLAGRDFNAMDAGPYFKFNPTVSLSVACESVEEADSIWAKLLDGATVLMEYQKYPFSEKYGWLNDKYGLSWQIGVFDKSQAAANGQKIAPTIMFINKYAGKTKEAMDFYTKLFDNSKINFTMPYEKGENNEPEGSLKYAKFTLDGEEFTAMDSSIDHKFEISEAISFLINCKDQAELDKFYSALSKDGEIQACGWVIDRFGVTWQVVPTILDKWLKDKDPEKAKRTMIQMLKMDKLDIEPLQKAYDGTA